MNIENFLLFLFKNNAGLIESLVVAILLASAFLAYRSFKISKDEELGVSPSGDLGQLEEMIKKLLEQSKTLPSAGVLAQSIAAAGPSGEASAAGVEATALLENISVLKKELEAKQGEIEMMKATSAGGAADPSSAALSEKEKSNLQNQIKELQRKLEEFDIISADIADLSFYKEENQRLQKELSTLKESSKSDPPAKTPASSAATPPPPETLTKSAVMEPLIEPSSESLAEPIAPPMNESLSEPMTAPMAELKKQEISDAGVQEVVNEDLIKEYAAMVDAQKFGKSSDNSDETETTESSLEEKNNPPAIEEVDLGTLDIDKMLNEAGSLPELATAPTEDVLNQALDPDKLATEAQDMIVDPQTKEVMGQFENFAKKEK